MTLPSKDELIALLDLDETSGILIWRARSERWFAGANQQARAARWNAKNAGKVAFSTRTSNGYCTGTIHGRRFLAHRVIWKMIHGDEPETVDHINGDRTDNSPCNLRAASHEKNSRNKALYRNNTSGAAGVKPTPYGKWIATVGRDGAYLGSFDTKEEAISARDAAMAAMGYHENHGRTERNGNVQT